MICGRYKDKTRVLANQKGHLKSDPVMKCYRLKASASSLAQSGQGHVRCSIEAEALQHLAASEVASDAT